MTSRQRVLAAINHEVPDRVPIDVGMYSAPGISAFAYKDLKDYLGLPAGEVAIHEHSLMLARVEEDILQRFRGDCIPLRPPLENSHIWQPRPGYRFRMAKGFEPVLQQNGAWKLERGEKSMIMPEGGYFFDGDGFGFEDPWEEAIFQRYVREAERVYKDTEYFTAYKGFHPFFSQDIEYFCSMLTDPDEIHEKNDYIYDIQIERVGKLINSMGGYVQAITMSGDLGEQNAPFCRPSLFEELCAPWLKKFCDFIHRNSDLKIFLHSCGAIEPLLPILIECGIDIINPVQISAKGMDPVLLKEKYGKQIVFWGGGCNTQHVLSTSSPQAVADNVEALVNTFKPGGGYVFAPVHNVQGSVPVENIVAMYDAAFRTGTYI